jgi:hypothetical protein
MPNAAPNAPIAMQSQQAGQVSLGCTGCANGSLWSRIPLWAKVLVPVGLLTTTLIVVIAMANRRRVAPYVEAFEEADF